MSYEKLGFESGQTLKAEHLNHMEEGIANACNGSTSELTQPEWGCKQEPTEVEQVASHDYLYMSEDAFNDLMQNDTLRAYYWVDDTEGEWCEFDKSDLYYEMDGMTWYDAFNCQWKITYTEAVEKIVKIPAKYVEGTTNGKYTQPEWGESSTPEYITRWANCDVLYMSEEEYDEIINDPTLEVRVPSPVEDGVYDTIPLESVYFNGDGLAWDGMYDAEWCIAYAGTSNAIVKIPAEYVEATGVQFFYIVMDGHYDEDKLVIDQVYTTVDDVKKAYNEGKIPVARVDDVEHYTKYFIHDYSFFEYDFVYNLTIAGQTFRWDESDPE